MLLQTSTQENPQFVKNFLFTIPNKSRVFNIYYSVHFVIYRSTGFLATLSNEYLLSSSFFFSVFGDYDKRVKMYNERVKHYKKKVF